MQFMQPSLGVRGEPQAEAAHCYAVDGSELKNEVSPSHDNCYLCVYLTYLYCLPGREIMLQWSLLNDICEGKSTKLPHSQ